MGDPAFFCYPCLTENKITTLSLESVKSDHLPSKIDFAVSLLAKCNRCIIQCEKKPTARGCENMELIQEAKKANYTTGLVLIQLMRDSGKFRPQFIEMQLARLHKAANL